MSELIAMSATFCAGNGRQAYCYRRPEAAVAAGHLARQGIEQMLSYAELERLEALRPAPEQPE